MGRNPNRDPNPDPSPKHDREPNVRQAPLTFIRVWSETKITNAPKSPWSKVNPWESLEHLAPPKNFPKLREQVTTYLNNNGQFFASEERIEANHFTREILKMARLLLEFGMYFDGNDRDIAALSLSLLEPAIPLLDIEGETTFDFDDITEPVVDSYLELLRILSYIMDCGVEHRVTAAFNTYEQEFIRLVGDADSKKRLTFCDFEEGETLDDLHDQLFKTTIISELVAMGSHPLIPDYFVSIILNLTKYVYNPLAMQVFRLLTRHYGQRTVAVQAMVNQQLLIEVRVRVRISRPSDGEPGASDGG